VEELRRSTGPVVVRVVPVEGEEVRGLVDPAKFFEEKDTIRFQRLRYGPSSWTVRYGGWPLVYTSGKYRRYEVLGGTTEMSLNQVKEIYREQYSWGLTLISLPLTLPVGLIDFLVHNATIAFDLGEAPSYVVGTVDSPQSMH